MVVAAHMRPGDIWIVHIPQLGTHEQSGTRPAVIVARVTKNIVTIIPCTSNELALRFPFTCALKPSKKNGLRIPSVALVFHLRAIDVSYLEVKIGRLDPATLRKIRSLARQLIG